MADIHDVDGGGPPVHPLARLVARLLAMLGRAFSDPLMDGFADLPPEEQDARLRLLEARVMWERIGHF